MFQLWLFSVNIRKHFAKVVRRPLIGLQQYHIMGKDSKSGNKMFKFAFYTYILYIWTYYKYIINMCNQIIWRLDKFLSKFVHILWKLPVML